ncbi:MAG: MFS transporter [Treponema sp.]|jgi:PPP family 3-phenylpropionic acid transporter|nr:MFS transporter [Treponema sp.]
MYFSLAFFLIYAAYAAINPYLPILLRLSGYSPSAVGILMGILEGAGIAGPFIFGHFADKWGRYKPGLIITHIMILLTLIPLTVFRGPLIAGLLMIVMGVGFRSAFPLLDAVVTLNIGPAGNYGRVRTAGSVGFVLMMLFLQITPFLRPDNPANIAWWMAITTTLALVSMLFIPGNDTNAGGRVFSAAPGRRRGGSIRTPLLIIGLLIIAISRLSMASINSFFSLFLVEYMGWNAVGFMWALASVSEVPFMFLSRRLIGRFGALPILTVSAAMVTARLSIYALFPYKGGVIIAQLLHSICYGLFHPAAVAFISGNVPPERRALGMSLYLSLGSGLPNLLGSILGGFIIDHMGYRALFGIFALFPVLAVGLYGLLIFIAKNPRRGYP